MKVINDQKKASGVSLSVSPCGFGGTECFEIWKSTMYLGLLTKTRVRVYSNVLPLCGVNLSHVPTASKKRLEKMSHK